MPTRPRVRTTHTHVEMQLSPAAYDEIAGKMREAEYDHAFVHENGVDEHAAIDMQGIAVTRAQSVICKSCVIEFEVGTRHECPGIQPKLSVPAKLLERVSYVTHEKKARGNFALTIGFLDLESVQEFHQWIAAKSAAQTKAGA